MAGLHDDGCRVLPQGSGLGQLLNWDDVDESGKKSKMASEKLQAKVWAGAWLDEFN